MKIDRQSASSEPIRTYRIVAAIRDRAGNMGFATNDYWVGESAGGSQDFATYEYDAAGCLTNLNVIVLEWDERYRLKRFVVPPSGGSVEYEYDVLGRRVSRTGIPPEGGTTNVEHYVYNGNQVVADLDGSGSVLRTYVWGAGIDNLLCFTDHTTSNTYYAIKDHQNTVIAFVDETGAVVESYEYTAYGEILAVKDGPGNLIGNQESAIATPSKAARSTGPPASTTSAPVGTIQPLADGFPRIPSVFGEG